MLYFSEIPGLKVCIKENKKYEDFLLIKTLTEDKKIEAIRRLNKVYDRQKLRNNSETKEFVKIVN